MKTYIMVVSHILVSALTYVAVMVLMAPPPVSRVAAIERVLAPGYGHCLRCERPWKFVEGHNTEYARGRAMFPLCERCWAELGTPENRLPYYRELWYKWEQSTPGYANWGEIEKAVLGGK